VSDSGSAHRRLLILRANRPRRISFVGPSEMDSEHQKRNPYNSRPAPQCIHTGYAKLIERQCDKAKQRQPHDRDFIIDPDLTVCNYSKGREGGVRRSSGRDSPRPEYNPSATVRAQHLQTRYQRKRGGFITDQRTFLRADVIYDELLHTPQSGGQVSAVEAELLKWKQRRCMPMRSCTRRALKSRGPYKP
jgi:hypothetical protein